MKKGGSGKQALLRILMDLSTRITPDDDLQRATRRLRAGLLLHGSTAEESYEHSALVAWVSRRNSEGEVEQQGIGVRDGAVLLTDMYNAVIAMKGLKEHVLEACPGLDSKGYDALEWVMWLVVSSVQMFSDVVEIEDVDEVDVDDYVEMMSRHYDHYFREKAARKSDG